MGEMVLQSPMANLGAVEFESMKAQGFRSDEAVGARRGASQPFFEEVGDRLGPGRGVVPARGSWNP